MGGGPPRQIVAGKVHVPGDKGFNPAGKVATIVAGMVAGADSITDLDITRHGGMGSLFGGVYAPSTLGVFLREFTDGHVRQLQAAARAFLVQLTQRTPLLPDAAGLMFVDVDSMLRRVYGKKKQGAGFGHTKVGGYDVRLRGLNPLIATLSTIDSAPVVAATRLRAGNAGPGGPGQLTDPAPPGERSRCMSSLSPRSARYKGWRSCAGRRRRELAAVRRGRVLSPVSVDRSGRRA